MRAREFLFERDCGRHNVGDKIRLIIDDHYLEQKNMRNELLKDPIFKAKQLNPCDEITHKNVGLVIAKMPNVIDELETVELAHKVYVWDPSVRVSIGLQRNSNKGGRLEFVLRTVLGWEPYQDGLTRIITV